jgi:hypothetical protein
MPRKKRLSEDNLSWIQDTTERAAEPEPAEAAASESAPSPAMPKSRSERVIFIEYDKNNGNIVSTHEVHSEADEPAETPWTTTTADFAVVKCKLGAELSDKDLVYIHTKYKVVLQRRKPKLVPR